jgi:pimeloyl-ACP methyl ester carboxylesterase
MASERIHRTKSADGTEIAGRVVGDGPPLVLVHGAMFDGDTAWAGVLPHLTDRFTCFLPSTRGKGLSGSSTDSAVQRLVEDVTAVVDSIGEPVGVAGWSQGATFTLGAAAQSDAVSAAAGHEPPVLETLDEEGSDRFARTVTRMAEYAGQGQSGGGRSRVH